MYFLGHRSKFRTNSQQVPSSRNPKPSTSSMFLSKEPTKLSSEERNRKTVSNFFEPAKRIVPRRFQRLNVY